MGFTTPPPEYAKRHECGNTVQCRGGEERCICVVYGEHEFGDSRHACLLDVLEGSVVRSPQVIM